MTTEPAPAPASANRPAGPRNGRPVRARSDGSDRPPPAARPSGRWHDGLPDPTVDDRPRQPLERSVWLARQALIRAEEVFEEAKARAAATEKALREHQTQQEVREIASFLRQLRPEERSLLRQMQHDRALTDRVLGAIQDRQDSDGEGRP